MFFYTLQEFNSWFESLSDAQRKQYRFKYYKGLGTSTSKEAKLYFNNMERHRIPFAYFDPEDDAAIELAFSKSLIQKRKEWLAESELRDTNLDHSGGSLRYKDFVNNELIHFSLADCARSIPSAIDGLKPG